MPASRLFFAVIVGLALGGTSSLAAAQPTAHWISLDDRQGPPDYAFGLNVSPDGLFYHVAIAGTFSSPNCGLAVVDRATQSVLARYHVGSFPEDVAFEVIPGTTTLPPGIARIFVTSSFDSALSVLDGQGQPVKTVPLGVSSYPFGLAVDPAGQRVAVTTKNHQIFLVDVKTLTVSATLNVHGYHGRPVFLADGRLLFGSAVPVGENTRVTATAMDPARPQAASVLELVQPVGGYPSCEDVALVQNGREAWFPILGADTTIRRVDTTTWQPVGTIPLAAYFPGGGLLHGLGASGEGLVLATSLGSGHNDVLLLDGATARVLTSIHLLQGQQPNDAVFTPDGREACVTMQYGQAGVYVITGLPQPAFRLLSDTLTPARGSTFQLTLRGAEHFALSVVGFSLTGTGPVQILGQTVSLSEPIVPFWAGPHDVAGRAVVPRFTVPNVPTLQGLTVHLQALAQERGFVFRVSNPLQLTIQ